MVPRLKSIIFLQEFSLRFSATTDNEDLHSYFSDCLLLCNDTMQCVFVIRLVLSKTVTPIRCINFFNYMYFFCVVFGPFKLVYINDFILFIFFAGSSTSVIILILLLKF